jgi:hypothetical protein
MQPLVERLAALTKANTSTTCMRRTRGLDARGDGTDHEVGQALRPLCVSRQLVARQRSSFFAIELKEYIRFLGHLFSPTRLCR